MGAALVARLSCETCPKSLVLNLPNPSEVTMTIVPGTPVKLPNGRDGVVVPAPFCARDRVLVKVKSGKKSWFSVDDCIPTFSAY